MIKNVGTIDKLIRILIAVVIGILYLTHQITGVAAIVLGVFAVIFIITSIISFCPLYTVAGLSTAKKK